MNYVQETHIFNLHNKQDFQQTLLEAYNEESYLMLSLLEGYEMTLEATEGSKGMVRKTFDRIVEFIRKISNAFLSKVKQLFGNRSEWLKTNVPKIKEMKFDNVTIEMSPYWQGDPKQGARIIKGNNPISEIENMRKDVTNKSTEKAKDRLFKQYLDADGNLADGLKTYFRYGKSTYNAKPVTLNGGQLKNRMLNDMIPYCQSYLNGFVKETKSAAAALENQIKQVQMFLTKAESSQSVGEAYIMLEQSTVGEVIPTLALLEAEGDVKPNKVVVRTEGEQQVKKETDKLKSMSVNGLTHARELLQCNQTVYAAMLTIGEEKFNAYFTALKGAMGKTEKPKKEKSDSDKVDKKKK